MSISDKVDILMVDDQPAKLLGYEAILAELGENLVKASSAREALEHLLRRDVAVILVDVIMPDLDGFALATLIRGHPRFETTPIIFVSAVALTDLDHLKGYEYGAVDYVPVPVVPDVLRAKVRVFCDLHRKTRQLEALNASLERRVEERTAELAATNAELEVRVELRTREREAALTQLHEVQKLESLGKITGGLAHDFNNLLAAVIGNLEPLGRRLEDAPQLRRFVDGAIEAAERGANLTSRLLAFARRQELRPEAVNVARLVGSIKELIQKSVGSTIELDLDFYGTLPPVLVDPNQLELALLNLALNSRDAMPEGGRLTISASRQHITPATAAADLKPGDYVAIGVVDAGTGMDEVTLRRAAEPFFTTKEIGKGTGLGLSMVHGLAMQSGGVLRIRSQQGAGTTVELWLPAAIGVHERQGTQVMEEITMPSGQYRVLLVEDDQMVADGTMAMLEDLGHTVILAESGDRALEIMQDETFDLVITDHAMPRMTGAELARHISAMRPGLPVLLATGYSELSGNDAAGLRRIEKPYRMEKLAATIESMIDQPERHTVQAKG